MGVLQVVPVGGELSAAMVGVREFQVAKLLLVADKATQGAAKEVQRAVEPLRIPTEVRTLKADPMMEMLRLVTRVLAEEKGKHDDIFINISSGSSLLNSAALCACYVNGAKGFGVRDDKAFPLPILRFSYYELVSDSKLAVLKALADAGGDVESLQELGERAGLDKSLLSYHIRGSRENKGLEELGLVSIRRGPQGRLRIRLTGMGHMILQGRGLEEPPPEKPRPKKPAR